MRLGQAAMEALRASVACFLTVHEHWKQGCPGRNLPEG